MAWEEARLFYLIVGWCMLGILLFTAGPMLFSLFLSFTSYNGFDAPVFIGMRNFSELFETKLFWQSLKVTFYYTFLAVPTNLITALFLAVLLNMKLPGLSWWRTIYYLPSVLSGVAVSLLWRWIYQPEYGVMNTLLWSLFHIQGPRWLFSTVWVIPSLVIMNAWSSGGNMLLFLAALQGVPTALYEAAALDGAGAARKFFHITLPMISPVIFFNLVMGIIGTFQVFTQAYVMTNKGGPSDATYFFVLYLFQQAFEYFQLGKASSLAWILFVIIMFFTALTFRTAKSWVYYEGETGR